MKIIKIEFRNINSLKGNHEVDFSKNPFTTSGLFAITGPTGSGKSSVLDVISLALFNKTPRLSLVSNNEIEKTGALITHHQEDAMAAVTYEAKAGRFRSEWSISTARTGKLRNYHMQLGNLNTGDLFDLKKSEVPKKNEELIGLNYDQFIKSVLLAQGEFARFLRTKKSERGELLEKITGTGIYRKLGQRSFEKFKEENQVILNQQNQILLLKERLLDENQKKMFLKEFEEKQQNLQEKKQKINSLKKQLELKESIASNQKGKSQQEIQKTLAENALKTFELKNGFPLQQHEKIASEGENLRQWSQLKKDLDFLKKDLDIYEKEKEKNRKAQEICLKNTQELVGKTIDTTTILSDLIAFGTKINSLQQEKKDKAQEYATTKKLLQRELQNVVFQLNEKDLNKNITDLEALQKLSEEKISGFQLALKNFDLKNLEAEKEVLSERLEQARVAWRKNNEIEKIKQNIEAIEEEAKKFTTKIDELPKEIATADHEVQLGQEKLEKIQLKRDIQLLQASLEEHRQNLKSGEPCPLCGSKEHPFAQDFPKKDDTLTAEISQCKTILNHWKNKLSTATAHLQTSKEGQKSSFLQAENLKAELAAEEKSFSKNYKHLYPDSENPNWEDLCKTWQVQIQVIQNLQNEEIHRSAIDKGIPLLKTLEEIFKQGNELKIRLEKLYSGNDIQADTNEISTQWIQLQETQKNLNQRLSELNGKAKDKSKELEGLESILLIYIQKQGFTHLENARKALMSEVQCNALRNERSEINNKITGITSTLELLETQLSKLKTSDSEATSAQLLEELSNCEKNQATLSEECEELKRQIKNHADNLSQIKKIKSAIFEKEKVVRRWRLLNELIGDRNGKKFNNFAQELSLGHLLQLANIRLQSLNERFLMDKPKENEEDGLIVIDKDMGGERRSIKTLSGGETFILSLSMALALSDLASRNVEINSLFIDEGFGTLDQETLDQTIDTLERLQAESSKTIGIISHIDSLKERISTQIRLKRNGQGYSSLEVFPTA